MKNPPPHIFNPGDGKDQKTIAKNWRQPVEWNRDAEESRTRVKVFLYHPLERIVPKIRNRLWKLIAATPHLDWLLTTAMPNILKYELLYKSLENVWLGISVHDSNAPELLELLRPIKAAAKFIWVFAEIPDVGTLDLTDIDWVLFDGRSGTEAELMELTMQLDWARALINNAIKAGAQIWFPFAQDDKEAQLAELLEFGLPTLDEMEAQLQAAVEAARAAGTLPVDLPTSFAPPLELIPAPAPEPPREEPPVTPAPADEEQAREDAQDCILLHLDDDVMTEEEWRDFLAGCGFDKNNFVRRKSRQEARSSKIKSESDLWHVRRRAVRLNADGEEIQADDIETYLCGGNLRVTGEIKRLGPPRRFFREVEFEDRWGKTTKVKIADDLPSSAVLRILAANGLEMTPIEADQRRIVEFLKGWKVRRHVIAVSRRWYNGRYITGRGAIGPASNEEVILDDSFKDRTTYCGTLEGWRSTIGAACVGNRLLTTSVCWACAGLILELLGVESMGLMLYSKTSDGKTVTANAACSVGGTPVSLCYSTQASIETQAAENSDTFLFLDEVHMAPKPIDFAKNIYMLGNGQGKGRYQTETVSWKIAFMIIGEESMSEVLANEGAKLRGGQAVRLLEIFANVGKGFGSFDTIHEHKDSAAFAKAIETNWKLNQGVAAEAFLQRVTADLPYAIRKMNETREAFIAAEKLRLSLTNAPFEVIRAMDHFAVAAAAGELATEYGTTGWPDGEAIRALSATFESWLLSQPKTSKSVKDGAQQVRQWAATNSQRLETRVGNDGRLEIDIPPDLFRREACAGFAPKEVARQLKAEGDLIYSAGGLTYQYRDKARVSHEVYRIRLAAGDSGDSGDSRRASKAVN